MRMNSGFYIHRILDLFIKITGIKKHKKKRHIILLIYRLKPYLGFGGDEGDRTPDLLNAIQALSQLSYAPMHN